MESLFAIFFSLFFGFIPMLFYGWLVYWTDRFEKEPVALLGGTFLWGAFVASTGAFLINTILGTGVYLFTESETATNLATGSIIAPVIEESLKGMAVLIVFLVFKNEFDSILDGIVYAAITALGFAAMENAYYIFSYGFEESGWGGAFFLVFVRVILVGWQHPFYTAFIGIGLAVSRLNRSVLVRLAAPVLGWTAAVITHSAHNGLATFSSGLGGLAAGTFFDWSGWLMMLLFVFWVIRRESHRMKEYLVEEVQQGTISQGQYQVAGSTISQSKARFKALFSGRYRITRRFYQTCAELAWKKYQLAKLGEESGNSLIIYKLRDDLVQLGSNLEV